MVLPALRIDMFLERAKPGRTSSTSAQTSDGPIFELINRKHALRATATLSPGSRSARHARTAARTAALGGRWAAIRAERGGPMPPGPRSHWLRVGSPGRPRPGRSPHRRPRRCRRQSDRVTGTFQRPGRRWPYPGQRLLRSLEARRVSAGYARSCRTGLCTSPRGDFCLDELPEPTLPLRPGAPV